MKKILTAFIVLCILGLNQGCLAASVLVPANTSVFVSPEVTVTSKDMSVDNIDCKITNDVTVDDNVIFKAGDRANLHIGEIAKARCWGCPGKLVISNGYVYDVEGNKHKVVIYKNYYGEEKTWPKTCGIISIFFLWPLAFCGFVHGGQATVSASSEIETSLASQFYFAK